jgi:RND family efflux transporter MFP subunit
MKRTLQSTLSVVAILSLGGFLWLLVVARRPEPPPAPPRVVGPVAVDAVRLAPVEWPVEVGVYGTLLARRSARLAPELPGRVAWVLPTWRPGAFVREGQELLRLDPKLYELELDRARAAEEAVASGLAAAQREREWAVDVFAGAEESLEIARREHERLQKLYARERVSASQVDQARAALVRAEVDVDSARGRIRMAEANESTARSRESEAAVASALAGERLARARVVAPFSGWLSGRAPAEGTFLAAGVPVVELLDLASLHLSASVHEDQLAHVEEGMPARVELPSRPGLETQGRVRAIGPAADPVTRNGTIEIEVENAFAGAGEDLARGLHAGLFARAVVYAGTREDLLWIDRRHVDWHGEQAYAYVLHEGLSRAERRELALGDKLGEGFEVRSGLAAGELLVTAPLDRVGDGVEVVFEAPAPGADAE